MSDRRIASIDIAKAICILLVVVGHYVPTDAPAWYKSMVEVIYGFHMPLFMFVSGYVYWKGATRKPVKYPAFILKKFNRLMIPYFLVSVLIIFIKMVTEKNMYLENPVTWTTFLTMFYIPSAGYFLWFVYVLFLIFLMIPFFHTKKRLNLLLVASLIWLVVPIPVTDWFCLAQWKSHLFYFVLGCMISREEKSRLFTVKMPLLLKTTVYAGFYSLLFCLSKNVFPELSSETIRPFTYLFFALAGIGFILNLSRYIDVKTTAAKQFFVKLSVFSYTIYLFHTTFEGFAKALLTKLPFEINSGFAFLLTTLSVVFMGIICPVILHRTASRYLVTPKR